MAVLVLLQHTIYKWNMTREAHLEAAATLVYPTDAAILHRRIATILVREVPVMLHPGEDEFAGL